MKTTSYSSHSRVRMQQRGIGLWMVEAALSYGERRWSHEAIRYSLTDRALRNTPLAARADSLRGLCVVVSRDGSIITAKWDFQLTRPGVLRKAGKFPRLPEGEDLPEFLLAA